MGKKRETPSAPALPHSIPPTTLSAIILAGGESSRLGRDKALLRIGGQTLVERTVAELSKISAEILISSNRPDFFQDLHVAAVVPDIVLGIGPLGGIHAGLHKMANEYGFFVACDMPFLDADVIREQIKYLHANSHDAVAPRWDGRIEPLHTIYGKACLPAIKKCIDRDERKIIAFYDDVRVAYWDLQPPQRWEKYFHNINTEDDLRDVERIIGQ